MATQSSPAATRLSLLMRARQRDPVAWRELVDLYGPLMMHWCRRCGLDEHAAADCVQEVFLAVATSIGTFRHDTQGNTFRGWLWTVARNKVRDYLRRVSKQPQATGGDDGQQRLSTVPDESHLPEDEPSDAKQITRLLQRGLKQVEAEFEAKSWQAFVRTTIDGVPTSVVANELGLPAATVRQYRSRILRRLKQHLGDLP